MRITKLQIKGFKSFGEKVELTFGNGITGVVGPNGCGKSNIVDAIRWVLGEQKTSALRSDKMENVIFNGSSDRKALQMAEVSLVFENTKNLLPTAYAEVAITRRYYRTGESEYLLNGVACRLKDITDLFLNTGIGHDSYAIIELKMVEQILNNKDNSRIELFQEAAGISKFKIRKKQALKKMEDTQADLERVDDLLFEIEKNMKSLERQAKLTEKYFQIKEEYKKYSLICAENNVKKYLDSSKEIELQNQNEIIVKTQISKEIQVAEAEIEKLKFKITNQEKLLASRQKALNLAVADITKYENEKKIKNQRLEYLSEKKNNLNQQNDQDRKSNERAEFSLKSLQEELNQQKIIFNKTIEKLAEAASDLEEEKKHFSTIQDQAKNNNSVLQEIQKKIFNTSKALEINEIQFSTLSKDVDNFSQDSQNSSSSLSEFAEKIQSLSLAMEAKKLELNQYILIKNQLQENQTTKEKLLNDLREKSSKVSRLLDSKRNEFNLTKSFLDNLEGYPEAVKYLKKQSSLVQKALLVSDIIGCDEKYRTPIEAYLENFTSYFVVENFDQAIQSVELLSKNNKGKANFFVMSSFDNFTPTPPKIFHQYNWVKVTDILEYDPKYAKLVMFLFDDVYFILDDNEDFPKDDHSHFLSLSGKIIKRKFSISGGSIGLFEGKQIGRIKALQKLEKEIEALSKDLAEIQKTLQITKNDIAESKKKDPSNEIDELQKQINFIARDLVSYQTREEQLQNLLISSSEKKEKIQEKIELLKKEIEEGKPALLNFQIEFAKAEKNNQATDSDFNQSQQQLQKKNQAFNAINIEYIQENNKIKSIEQEIGYKTNSYESSKQRIEKNTAELSQLENEISLLASSPEFKDEELAGMYEEKKNIETAVREVENEYYQTRGDITALENALKLSFRKKELADQTLQTLAESLSQYKLQLASAKERIQVEFQVELDLATIAEKNYTITESEDVQNKLNSAKNAIEKMGPINPLAMEAYTEVSERHIFITTQKNDLNEAKKSLLSTISEIDSQAKDDFLIAFAQIRENFILVFRSLFTENDTCDLKLVDESNPTESAIEIIAKPKGKKPLTIAQLSGGEKTLTAISLLFAIYLLKPAPFCIFDEVDAPLDDTNIDKFNQIIRKFSANSQFIIVTHNKKTMEAADIMYGITMLQKGISSVVPVDLRSN